MPIEHQLTIVVVTYNSAHCIERLSEGIRHLPHIIVVDNGSEDDTIATCQRFLPQARIEAAGQNLGFGAANNRALKSVETPFALLLNPDCEVTSQAIDDLVAVAQTQSDAAMWVPQVVNETGKSMLNYGWVKHLWKSKGGAAEGLCCVAYATGAVMLLNMSVTRPHGYFDEAFFLYYEDDDLCLKYFNAHLPIIVVPQVTVFHASRGSVKTKSLVKQEYWRGYHHAQSKILMVEKYQNANAAQRLRVRKMCSGVLVVLFRALTLNARLCARMAGRVVGLWQYKDMRRA